VYNQSKSKLNSKTFVHNICYHNYQINITIISTNIGFPSGQNHRKSSLEECNFHCILSAELTKTHSFRMLPFQQNDRTTDTVFSPKWFSPLFIHAREKLKMLKMLKMFRHSPRLSIKNEKTRKSTKQTCIFKSNVTNDRLDKIWSN